MARIGVNALYLIPGGVGGTEIYLRQLLRALAEIDSHNLYFVFTNRETGGDLVPRQSNFFWRRQAVRATFRPSRIVWEQLALPLEAARERLDVMFNPGFTAPLLAPCRQASTFHDLQHKRHPEYFRWFDLPFWRLLLWASAHRSRRLIAPSESVRADLTAFYSVERERIAVIAHGVNPDFFKLDRSRLEPFFLCASTLHPHKNLERLIRAYARRPRTERLILAGLRGFHTRAVEKLIADLHLQDRVEITGWLTREKIIALYGKAWACVYPSTFEGFGLPVLEALAAGVPLACSDIAVLREVAGPVSDQAAPYLDPLDAESISVALDRIAGDEELRGKLSRRGPERARAFTWKRAAERTLQALLA